MTYKSNVNSILDHLLYVILQDIFAYEFNWNMKHDAYRSWSFGTLVKVQKIDLKLYHFM